MQRGTQLGGTSSEANISILKQAGIIAVSAIMEYTFRSWATASKTDLGKVNKVLYGLKINCLRAMPSSTIREMGVRERRLGAPWDSYIV